MVHGWESKGGEEGCIATGPSFCLNNMRVVNWGIVLQESNYLWSAYHASGFRWIFATSSELEPSIFQSFWYH